MWGFVIYFKSSELPSDIKESLKDGMIALDCTLKNHLV